MICDILKDLREKKKLSREQVADMLGISKRTLESYEYGKREPNIEMINKFADFYGVTTDFLLGREPQKNPLADLEIDFSKTVDSEKFIELYSGLPELAKQIFVEIMAKLSQAMQPNQIRTKTTYTCGELEDRQKAEADEAKDAG